MDAPAAKPRPLDLRELAALLRPFPGRLSFAARLALICALTALLALTYQTPSIALTVYVAFFLNKPDRMGSILGSVVMLALVTVVVGLVVLIAKAVIDHVFLRVASMALISFGLLFLASASKLKPLAGTLALIIAYALDLLGNAFGGEIATRGLLYAWLFIGMPFAVSLPINLLLAPAPRRLAERALADRLALGAAMLTGPTPAERRAFAELERAGTAEIDAHLRLAGIEATSPKADIAALRQASGSTLAILLAIALIDREPRDTLPEPLRRAFAEKLDAMAAILRRGRYPVEIVLAHEETALLSPRGAHLAAQLREAITGFAAPAPALAPASQAAPPARPRAGFFLPDAFTNAEHVQYALKTTAAAMFCYILYSLLDWPGIHTCLITCYIVSLGTVGETVEKLSLRILGCMVGAAVGLVAIVYLIPGITSLGALMAVVFAGALGAGWVAAGSPRISYAGFQIAFAFFLSVIQGPSPGFDLTITRDRTIGILLGNLVVYFIFTQIAPISVGRRIDAAIAALLRELATLATATAPAARRGIAARTHARIGAIARDLALAAIEPARIRHDDAWLDRRREAIDAARALEAELLASPDGHSAHAARLAARLETIAAQLGMQAPPEPGAAAPDAGDSPRRRLAFRDLLDRHLRSLEALFPDQPQSQRSPAHAPPVR